jgi:hypothetical protein
VTDVDLYLLIPAILRIIPEITKRRLEKSSANSIEIGHVVPLLFAGGKHALK